MKKHSKKYVAALKNVDASKVYTIEEAVPVLKKTAVTKFDSTVDVSFALNVNPTSVSRESKRNRIPDGNGKAEKP